MPAGTTPRPDRQHGLPDGRTLAWCEYGRTDGLPLLYFHGIPGSRIDGRLTDDVAAGAGHLHTGERWRQVFTGLTAPRGGSRQ